MAIPHKEVHTCSVVTREATLKLLAGLAENRCLSRHARGARLLQIAEQPLALGAKFRARVVLDIEVRLW